MLTLTEIKKAYISLLRKKYPNTKIYGMEVVEGYDTPSLFVRATRTGLNERYTKNVYQSGCTIETVYFQKIRNEEDALKVVEEIRGLLGSYLDVNGKKLPITDFTLDYAGKEGNIPTVRFTMNYMDTAEKEETKETMQKIMMKEEL